MAKVEFHLRHSFQQFKERGKEMNSTLKMSSPVEAFSDLLRVGLEFRVSSSLAGIPAKFGSTGQLLEREAAVYAASDVVYTVVSYSTPIAWMTRDGIWTVPNIRYSATTTKIQNKIKNAVINL